MRATLSTQSIVATQEEVEFCDAFNFLVEKQGSFLNPADFPSSSSWSMNNNNLNNAPNSNNNFNNVNVSSGDEEENNNNNSNSNNTNNQQQQLPLHLRFPIFFSPPRVVNFLFNNQANRSTIFNSNAQQQQQQSYSSSSYNINDGAVAAAASSFVIRPSREVLVDEMSQRLGVQRCTAGFMLSSEIALFRICGVFSSTSTSLPPTTTSQNALLLGASSTNSSSPLAPSKVK